MSKLVYGLIGVGAISAGALFLMSKKKLEEKKEIIEGPKLSVYVSEEKEHNHKVLNFDIKQGFYFTDFHIDKEGNEHHHSFQFTKADLRELMREGYLTKTSSSDGDGDVFHSHQIAINLN
jgi:hypothetical protein